MEDWMVECDKDFGDLLIKPSFESIKELNATQSHFHFYKKDTGLINLTIVLLM
jgi:hypothetical protein